MPFISYNNGELVRTEQDGREYDYEDFIPVTLDFGENRILIKVQAIDQLENYGFNATKHEGDYHPNLRYPWEFSCRINMFGLSVESPKPD